MDGVVTKNPIFKKNGKIYVIYNEFSKHQHFMVKIRKISKNKATFHWNQKYEEHINTHMTRINKLP
ncbi:hypothetical protein NBRC111893_195 [Lentilactobacillus kosonis]|uniref:Uncharacterized protein n=1 Tax=Lentilactobacillus kosonis TaxID=2810561 RepID=A0A401FI63_9LACO|nr:hypothetical protein NBRC111893_195 [Lentilactobacillus kosonis]